MDKALSRLMKIKRQKIQITKGGMKEGTLLPTLQKSKRILRKYYEQLYANKLDSIDEMEKFL